MTVTVLGKPNCVACTATERTLTQMGIDFDKKDVTADETAYERAISLGHMAAPVVIIEETGQNWSGFRPELLKALAS